METVNLVLSCTWLTAVLIANILLYRRVAQALRYDGMTERHAYAVVTFWYVLAGFAVFLLAGLTTFILIKL